jgi:lysine 6-dehydrogenase
MPVTRASRGGYRFGVLGAGRQGTAAAYDLITRGEAESVTLADRDLPAAQRAAERVNDLSGTDRAHAIMVDATDHAALVAFLDPLDAFLSAASYRFNHAVSVAAIEARTHMCDLGGNTTIVRQQLALDEAARAAGVCVVPDCGEAPGLASNLMAYALDQLDEPEELLLYDGGLPLEPVPPWNYVLTFNIDGLTNEYDGATTWKVDGRLMEVECLDPAHDELVDFGPPFGVLEAFAAATGSTTPWTIGERVRTLKAKVLRYPGHAAQFRAFRDLGLFSEVPIEVGGQAMVPRDVLHVLLEPRILARPGDADVVIARVVSRGRKDGRQAEATADLLVYPNERLGFSAMEQATGWHAAIVCHLMASGQISPGATPVEVAVRPADMVAALRARGFDLRTRVGAPAAPF